MPLSLAATPLGGRPQRCSSSKGHFLFLPGFLALARASGGRLFREADRARLRGIQYDCARARGESPAREPPAADGEFPSVPTRKLSSPKERGGPILRRQRRRRHPIHYFHFTARTRREREREEERRVVEERGGDRGAQGSGHACVRSLAGKDEVKGTRRGERGGEQRRENPKEGEFSSLPLRP